MDACTRAQGSAPAPCGQYGSAGAILVPRRAAAARATRNRTHGGRRRPWLVKRSTPSSSAPARPAPRWPRRCSKAGMRTALIERGGSAAPASTSAACPTKTLVASARAAHLARRAAEFGVDGRGAARRHAARQGAQGRGSCSDVARGARGLAAAAWPDVDDDRRPRALRSRRARVRVGDRELDAPSASSSTSAAAPRVPDLPGVDDVPILDNSSIMELDVGARATWSSSAAATSGSSSRRCIRRFGAEVTVVERSPRLIGREDEDVSAAIRAILEARRHRDAHRRRVHRARQTRQRHRASTSTAAASAPVVDGIHVLLAVGRTPNTDDLGLDKAGVAIDERGYITVDDQLRTSVPGIWALGDCNGRGAFTHTSYNDYEIVAANLLDGDPRTRQRPHRRLRALHRSAARPRRHDRGARCGRAGRKALRRQAMPMTRVGRAVENGRDAGLHEDAGRCRDEAAPRRRDPRPRAATR